MMRHVSILFGVLCRTGPGLRLERLQRERRQSSSRGRSGESHHRWRTSREGGHPVSDIESGHGLRDGGRRSGSRWGVFDFAEPGASPGHLSRHDYRGNRATPEHRRGTRSPHQSDTVQDPSEVQCAEPADGRGQERSIRIDRFRPHLEFGSRATEPIGAEERPPLTGQRGDFFLLKTPGSHGMLAFRRIARTCCALGSTSWPPSSRPHGGPPWSTTASC